MELYLINKKVQKGSHTTRIRYRIKNKTPTVKNYIETFKVEQNTRFAKGKYNPCKDWTIPRFLLIPFCRYMKTCGVKVFTQFPKFKNEEIELPYPDDLWEEKLQICENVTSQMKKTGGCLLKFGAGAGKTITMCQIMAMMKMKTVVICMGVKLASQMYSDIVEKTGIDENRIGRVYGEYKFNGFEKDIYVMVINSAANIDIDKFSYFGMMVFDEIQEYGGPARSLVMQNSPCQYMLGMSATPEKNWNWTSLTHRCGELYDANISVKEEVFNCTTTIIKYYGPGEYTQKLVNASGNMCCSYMADQFADDEKRNWLICDRINKYVDMGLSGIVFTTTKKHVAKLHDEFKSFYPNVSVGLIYSDIPEKERDRIADECDVLFTTYKCCGTGFNQPRLRFMLKAGPHKTNSGQIDKRIFRGKDDGEMRYIDDVVDMETPLKSQLYERKKFYENARSITMKHTTIEVE